MNDNAASTVVLDSFRQRQKRNSACRTPAYCIPTGKIDGALTFNGTTDYVNVGNVIGTGAYTKVAWVKRDAAGITTTI